MRTLICAVAATVVALAGASTAFADAEAGQGYFSVMGTYLDDDKDRNVEDGINGGQIGIGKAVNEKVNVALIVQAALAENANQDQLGIGLDLQRVFMRDERFSPYLHAGVGFFQVKPSGAFPKQEGAMYSAGAGFMLDLFDSNVALRGEWRHRLDSAMDNENMNDNLFSLGLHLPFGDSTPKWVDSDGDGVEDRSDNCPNTPRGAPVDAFGCELDSDGDGVKDSMDQCPGTPRGVAVDANGCPNDSDGDGVSDDKDRCPGTPAGQSVDANGCELDDGDGVVNRLDQCPGTPAGTQVDFKGCEIKEEIRLEGVNFETNSDRLLPTATTRLNQAVETLTRNPTIKVEVAGHTDSDGSAAYNESLSARRAQTVHDYLANAGISVDRMTVRGYGESEPIADNSTAAGKAENRRVVLRITER